MLSTIKILAAAGLAVTLSSSIQAQETIVGTLTDDSYNYWSVADGGIRDRAAIFSFNQAPPPAPQFFFDYHDGLMIAKWSLAIPPALVGESLQVESARIEIYNRKDAEWDPTANQVRLFAAGVTGSNGFTEATWNESTAYVGPSAFAAGVRDPFPRDLLLGTTASNLPAATAWALGSVNPSEYTGVPANDPDEAFKVTFELDVNNATIQSELQDDLDSGTSMWVIASTYAAAQPPAVAHYPQLITREGVSNASYGTAQVAPRLILEVSASSSASDWLLYN